MKSSDLLIILSIIAGRCGKFSTDSPHTKWTLPCGEERGTLNHYFTLILFGDLLGLPLLRLTTLRLLPHIFPELKAWKRSMLRERDLTEKAPDV